MRSQKQSNKAPRPFKNSNSERGWSGGKGHSGFIPPPKPILRPVQKPEAAKSTPEPNINSDKPEDE